MNLDSALGDMAALSEAELAEFELTKSDNESRAAAGTPSPNAAVDDRPKQPYRFVAFWGVIATTLVITAVLWFANPVKSQPAPVATLVADVDAVLLCDGQPCSSPELHPGNYHLEQGLKSFVSGLVKAFERKAAWLHVQLGTTLWLST